jgi:LacI family transcriptional regulator, galactose operon repressor
MFQYAAGRRLTNTRREMRKGKRSTITDVADKANVSVGTVSNFLNGTTNVSPALRDRIERAMHALGYEQNMLAHAQRRQRAAVVGISVPHVDSAYLAALIESFEDIAAVRGYQVMQVLTRRDPQVELRRVRELLRHRIAGLLLVPTYDPRETLELIHASGTPAVLVDRPNGDERFDEVTFNNREVMRDATDRLIRLGHRRILLVVQSQSLSISRIRIEALRERAAAAPFPVEVSVLEVGDDPQNHAQRLAEALGTASRPLAVVVSNSVIAGRALRALKGAGDAFPSRISLLAFEEPEWAELTSPQLSVIRQPVKAIAREAWELLLRRMRGEAFPVQRLELRAEIVLRDSVQPVGRERRRA